MGHWKVPMQYRDICVQRVRATGRIQTEDCNNLKKPPSWKHDYSLMNFTGNGKSYKNKETVPTRRLGGQSAGSKSKPSKEFVVYASIFGNYRNEGKGLEKALNQSNHLYTREIDRFLFTDSKNITDIPGWTIVRMEVNNSVHEIPGSRVIVKRLKFQGHPKLEQYRYWIHVDTSRHSLKMLNKFLKMGLLDFVRCHPSKALFVQKHPKRKTIQQEVVKLKRMPTVQPLTPLKKWDANLQPVYPSLNRVRLPWTNLFVLDSHQDSFVRKWESIYDTLLSWGLFRDQVVYSYALVDVKDQVAHIHPNMNMSCQDRFSLEWMNPSAPIHARA
jgi:hypothetical protein